MADEHDDGSTPQLPSEFLVDDSTREFFEEYVGPGKKYPNVGELAKAYKNADKHISELTKDTGKFKTEAESLRELLMENLTNPKPNDDDHNNIPNDDAPNHEPGSNDAPPKDESVDIKALVKEALGEVTTEKQREDNAKYVEEMSIKKFGDQQAAVKAVADKAAELGLSPQWIANLAFESPKAYFATMGFTPDEAPKSHSTPNSSSDVNTERFKDQNPSAPAPNTYRYFMEIRRTDPAKFRSIGIQQALLKAAQENPDFYK